MKTELLVNGRRYALEIDPTTPLLWALRDHLGLTGTKYGCGIGQCGACTVHANGAATRSCQVPVSALNGVQIVTIEGLGAKQLHPVQQAWLELNVPQCGYCQAGMLMAAVNLLNNTPRPTDEDIQQSVDNLCRCGTYPRVRAAIHRASALMAEGK
jgi:isoquinoline 1-oxidoreductase alpha subunit